MDMHYYYQLEYELRNTDDEHIDATKKYFGLDDEIEFRLEARRRENEVLKELINRLLDEEEVIF